MAIVKELESSYGCSITYHRITSININYKIKKVIICLASYLSKEARTARCNALEEIDIEVPIEDFYSFYNTNVIECAYQWLKTNVVGFEECIDDLEVVVEVSIEETKEEV